MTPCTPLLTADPAAPLHACISELAALDLDQLGAEELAGFLRSLSRGEARMAALRLQALARADRIRAAATTGAASTSQWAATVANTDQADACRQVSLAQGLESRTATQKALSSGVISAEHAAVIIQADKKLPTSVSVVQREQIEIALLARAEVLAPTALRKAARRALAAVEPDVSAVDAHENQVTRTEEEIARSKTRLSLHDNGDGTVSGHFTIPTLHGELLRKIVQTITAPRRGRLGASRAQVGDAEERTDWDRARGQALCQLIEHLPTDHLHPKTAATLLVKIDEATLRGALKVAALDTGGVLSADEALRLACNASILPAILNSAGVALHLGRSARLFSEPQRVAKSLEYEFCAADGCETPYAWCELHHKVHWEHGGCSNLEDAIPLCQFHHQRIHDQGNYIFNYQSDGSVTFHRRT
jgi:hypothetical protein